MKKIKFYTSYLSYIINNPKFIFTLIAIILINVQGILYLDDLSGFYNGLFSINTTTIYNICLVLFAIINSLLIFDHFEKNKSYAIRCESKEKYNISLIKIIVLTSTFIILLSLVFCVILLNIKYIGTNILENNYMYNIPNILYFLFYMLRKIVYISIVSTIIIYIKKNFGFLISNIVFVGIIILFFCYPSASNVISKFGEINLFFGSYFSHLPHVSFVLELCCSLFIGIILTISCFILYKFSQYKKVEIE